MLLIMHPSFPYDTFDHVDYFHAAERNLIFMLLTPEDSIQFSLDFSRGPSVVNYLFSRHTSGILRCLPTKVNSSVYTYVNVMVARHYIHMQSVIHAYMHNVNFLFK